jgi:low affinity Fe/Cu permease
MNEAFRRLAARASAIFGSSMAALIAAALVLGWAVLGPVLHYSDGWQLFINTVSSIVTFLMVFLIQNTQNRDVKALQLKLDELIRAVAGARTQLVQLEAMSDEELEQLRQEFERLRSRHGPPAATVPAEAGGVAGISRPPP